MTDLLERDFMQITAKNQNRREEDHGNCRKELLELAREELQADPAVRYPPSSEWLERALKGKGVYDMAMRILVEIDTPSNATKTAALWLGLVAETNDTGQLCNERVFEFLKMLSSGRNGYIMPDDYLRIAFLACEDDILRWHRMDKASFPVGGKYGPAAIANLFDEKVMNEDVVRTIKALDKGVATDWLVAIAHDGAHRLTGDGFVRFMLKYARCTDAEGRPLPCYWSYPGTGVGGLWWHAEANMRKHRNSYCFVIGSLLEEVSSEDDAKTLASGSTIKMLTALLGRPGERPHANAPTLWRDVNALVHIADILSRSFPEHEEEVVDALSRLADLYGMSILQCTNCFWSVLYKGSLLKEQEGYRADSDPFSVEFAVESACATMKALAKPYTGDADLELLEAQGCRTRSSIEDACLKLSRIADSLERPKWAYNR